MKNHFLIIASLLFACMGLHAQAKQDVCSIESIESLTQEATQLELLHQIDSLNLVLHDPEIQPLPGQLSDKILGELMKETDFLNFYRNKESAIPTLFDNPTAKDPRLCGDMMYLTFNEADCSFRINLETGSREIMEASDPNSWCNEYSINYYFDFIGGQIRLLRIVEAGTGK